MNQQEKANQAEDEKMLRDHLAIDRTRLANQRTLLAFIRTSLYLEATAMAIIELKSLHNFLFLSWILVFGGVVLVLIGVVNYFRVKKKINHTYEDQE